MISLRSTSISNWGFVMLSFVSEGIDSLLSLLVLCSLHSTIWGYVKIDIACTVLQLPYRQFCQCSFHPIHHGNTLAHHLHHEATHQPATILPPLNSLHHRHPLLYQLFLVALFVFLFSYHSTIFALCRYVKINIASTVLYNYPSQLNFIPATHDGIPFPSPG